MSETIIALVSAVFGGAGLKAFEVWLTRGKVRDDTASNLRAELRAEVTSLREELRRVEKDLDDWKAKYYDLLQKHNELHGEFIDLNRFLGIDSKLYKREVGQGDDSSTQKLNG